MTRIICLIIGYLFGCILTAEIVTHKIAGKSSREIGSHNPGMANIMSSFGFKAGITVLAGDLGKTTLACFICWLLFHKDLGQLTFMYAGLGATLGHDFPFWNGFHGGKGVATTCMFIGLASLFWGILSDVLGAVMVYLSGYLAVGGTLIPIFFIIPAFLVLGKEAGAVAIVTALLMIYKSLGGLREVFEHKAEKFKYHL